ncbi:MAG: DUF4263 domain-containing protein [Candidatus Cloacimonetes bacterium]|nr:DUF4263 domain-containing protein [Candidatus Cloacimonadota bacterium]MCB5260740.1 DUF4263 domain-containing protein [Candidatus Cloacimonadota bacterium]MCK9242815.1 DUF4263 domain-containing protein [Candidatus Cloacimonadota bacterium]MDD3103703.1 DUF4263 domain-containing protein [Candidatus Cloacimonadota bacterium]MDD3533735.1 DUF4263 domain-containing protein [Candidatus Cloacimonadota bacterium]
MIEWDLPKVEKELKQAYCENSELKLLSILKSNTFLFYELFSRKQRIQPIFHEISFGARLRCDFAWLNDNSDGPEWVLVEIEKPCIQLFTKVETPTAELNKGIEQVRSWQRYFDENPHEQRRIFGFVSRFRYVLVTGSTESWQELSASKWRSHFNKTNQIEVRTCGVFYRAIEKYINRPDDFWSFKEHPITLGGAKLKKYWEDYRYMDYWRALYN